MANLGEATYRLKIDSTDFKKGIKEAKRGSMDLKASFSLVSAALTGTVATGLAAVGKAAFDAYRHVETLTSNFETLLGSQPMADQFVETMRELSKNTTLSFQAVGSAAKQLLAFGVAADEVEGVIGRLGDAALGDSETMQRLARAYGQMRAGLVANLEDINQFIDAGVPLLQALAKEVGVAESEIKALISTGTVGFDKVEAALRNMTGEGGRFEGAMAKAADTIDGRLNLLMGELDELLIDLFDTISNEGQAAQQLVSDLTDLAKVAQQLVGEFDRLRPYFEVLSKTPFGGLLTVFSLVAPAVRDAADEIERIERAMDSVQHIQDIFGEGTGIAQAMTATKEAASGAADQVERVATSLQYLTDQYRLYGMTRIESDAAAFAAEEANRLAAEAQTAQSLANMADQYRLYGWSRVEADRMATEAIAAANKAADDDRMQRERANAAARDLLRKDDAKKATEVAKYQEDAYREAATSIMASFKQMEAMATSTYKATAAAARKATGEEKESLKELAMEQHRIAVALWAFNKAAAIGMAIVNTAEAVTKTMTSVPYPFNIPLAVLQGAAGALQIGVIAAQPPPPPPRLAEGGIIMRETTVVAGEAGPEAIIPLDRFPARDRQPTVVVNVQNLLGGTEEELAVRLDQALKKRAQFD